eukprot:gene18632-25145_t
MNKAGSVTMGRKVAAPTVSAPRMVARAQAEKGPLSKFSDSIGMPTDDGFFGFTPFAEQWAGRWAMLGFASSCVGEVTIGKGALGQLGLVTPSTDLLVVLSALTIGATFIGTAITGKKVLNKELSKSQVARYKNFLRLGSSAEENSMMKGDAPVPPPPTSVEATADASTSDPASGEASTSAPAASAPASSQSAAQKEMYPGESNDLAFAQNIEITNGRWAMVGFLSSILVEAATGNGIFGQLIVYLKASGALGERSGF